MNENSSFFEAFMRLLFCTHKKSTMRCTNNPFLLLEFTYPFRNEIPKVRKIKVIKIRKKGRQRKVKVLIFFSYGNKKRHTHCLHYIPPFLIHSFSHYLLFVYPVSMYLILQKFTKVVGIRPEIFITSKTKIYITEFDH